MAQAVDESLEFRYTPDQRSAVIEDSCGIGPHSGGILGPKERVFARTAEEALSGGESPRSVHYMTALL
ncbi:hypothetical protein [Rhodococcus opacus]|uniref:hypothetical protein n=1 Tax=Rhodococcus opacus TaxID=37919 RepID=UPI001ED8F585|nr:hypothetical protein [Rhodococcus opacus]